MGLRGRGGDPTGEASEVVASAPDLEELGEPEHVLPCGQKLVNLKKSILKELPTYFALSDS